MARIRTIKPEFFTSLTLARVSRTARLTFVGLWTYCDDEGRGRAEPRLIKAAVWPLDDDYGVAEVEADLAELAAASLIQRYEVDGSHYLAIRNWAEHQKIGHPTPSKLPPPPTRRSDDVTAPHEILMSPPEPRMSPPETFSLERKGKERNREAPERRGKEILTADEASVIAYYRAAHPKRLRGDPPPKLLRLLRTALRAYPATDLCRAIDGNAASKFHRENGHLGLELILRDAEKIDYFLDLAGKAETRTLEMTDEFGEMRLHTQRDGWWGYEKDGQWVPTIEVSKVPA